jgi:hypothetical protein
MSSAPDIILLNGNVTTLDRTNPEALAIASGAARSWPWAADAIVRRGPHRIPNGSMSAERRIIARLAPASPSDSRGPP